MKDVLFLAYRYLLFNRWKTGILIAAITVAVLLPLALELVLEGGSQRLRARAASTPLLIGAPGSPLELVLRALYFGTGVAPPLDYATVDEINKTGFATAIPLHLQHRVGAYPVVGTSPDYFGFRDLRVVAGRMLAISGEAVLGAAAARGLGAEPGGTITTSPEAAFDLAGSYPTRLRVVGVLAPTGTADDQAVLVDVRTSWIIAGIGHGHEDLDQNETAGSVLRREGNNIIANAAVMQYQEIDPKALAEFHYHGDPAEFPLSAVIAVPNSTKSDALLQGRYQDPDLPVRVVQPASVMDELLGRIFSVRQYVLAAVAVLSLATLATIALVFLLSIRLRRAEISTMTRIGAAPGRVAAILGAEILLVLTASVLLAGLLTALATNWDEELFRWILLSEYR